MRLNYSWKKTVIILCGFWLNYNIYSQSDSSFTNIEEARKNPLAVVHLDLTGNKLKVFPEDIFLFTNLKTLSLKRNKLRTLPEGWQSLIKLEKLNLAKNKLEALPNSIGELSDLKTLDISQNNIYELPSTIGKLSQLSHLYIWNNNIVILPDAIFDCKKLIFVDIRHIQLNRAQQSEMRKLLPFDANIKFSPPCACD
jgi:Leucine-rich repeat (LRR) protein